VEDPEFSFPSTAKRKEKAVRKLSVIHFTFSKLATMKKGVSQMQKIQGHSSRQYMFQTEKESRIQGGNTYSDSLKQWHLIQVIIIGPIIP
jgi:hypothetical protein